jgi:hypothetical protein
LNISHRRDLIMCSQQRRAIHASPRMTATRAFIEADRYHMRETSGTAHGNSQTKTTGGVDFVDIAARFPRYFESAGCHPLEGEHSVVSLTLRFVHGTSGPHAARSSNTRTMFRSCDGTMICTGSPLEYCVRNVASGTPIERSLYIL